MGDFIDMTVNFTGPLVDPDTLAKLWHYKILEKFIKAADQTLQGATADAPVGETGDLRDSGAISMDESGPGEFSIEVGFGGGLPFTSKDYHYPEGASTSKYPDGDMEADTYPWFNELGHLSRAGNMVPPRPFLGPNFDLNADGLVSIELEGLLDR